jgi:MFS family permease
LSKFRLFTYENMLLLILGTTFGIVFFDRLSVNFLMPFIKEDLHLTNTQIGLIGAAISITWSASNIAAGRLSDTLGRRKPLLIGSVIVFSLCTFVSGVANSFGMLALARMFMGLAEGPAPPLMVATLAEASSPHRRGLNGGLFLAFQPLIAGLLAPVVLVWIAQTIGWREAFYFATVPGLIMAVVIARFVRETPKPRAAPKQANTPNPDGELLSMRKIIGTRNIWLCAAICTFMMAAAMLKVIFLPLYLVNVRGIEPMHMAWIMGAVGFVGLPVLCFIPGLSDRIGRKPVVFTCLLIGMLGPIAALFYQGPTIVLAALLTLSSVSNGAAPLVIMAIPSESLPMRSVGTAVGFIPGFGELVGSFGASALGGYIADKTSLAAPFVMAIACLGVACIACLFLKETVRAKAVGLAPAV